MNDNLPTRRAASFRDVVISGFHGGLVSLLLGLSIGVYVHWSLQGNWGGALWPGSLFGVPEAESSASGMRPITDIGWDGQFYFHQANDIFANGEGPAHSDNPPYRYQRIGLPLIAKLLSMVLFQERVSPFFYLMTQVVIVALAMSMLVYWLRLYSCSAIWAYAWPLCSAVINAVSHGMPDPTGDAFFVFASVAILSGRLKTYVVATTLMLLVREGYAVFAAGVFVLSVSGFVSWYGIKQTGTSILAWSLDRVGIRTVRLGLIGRLLNGGYFMTWTMVFALLLPLTIMVAWHGYVAHRFGVSSPAAAGGVMLSGFLVGPWTAFIQVLGYPTAEVQTYLLSKPAQVLMLQSGLLVLGLAVWTAFRTGLRQPFFLAVLPYMILLMFTSVIMWDHYSGFGKALGTPLITLILAIPYGVLGIIRPLLIAITIHGPFHQYQVKRLEIWDGNYAQERVELQKRAWGMVRDFKDKVEEPGKTLSEFKSEWLAPEQISVQDLGRSDTWLFNHFHRAQTRLPIRVRNNSQVTWNAKPTRGLHSMAVSYRWLDMNDKPILDGLRTPLVRTVQPGEILEQEIKLQSPTPGKYKLILSMIQEGDAWFDVWSGGKREFTIDIP